MITVYAWVEPSPVPPEQATMDHLRQAVVPDQPHVNATCPVLWDPDASQLRAYIAEAWNREMAPDPPATVDDFDFQSPPADWVNPNSEAEQAAAAEGLVVVKPRA